MNSRKVGYKIQLMRITQPELTLEGAPCKQVIATS